MPNRRLFSAGGGFLRRDNTINGCLHDYCRIKKNTSLPRRFAPRNDVVFCNATNNLPLYNSQIVHAFQLT